MKNGYVLVLVAALSVILTISGCSKIRSWFKSDKKSPFDPKLAVVTVSSKDSRDSCYAVVYQEHPNDLVFMSVAHYFEKNPGPYHISLDYLKIKKVWRPDPKRDLVFFTVDRRTLTRGKDYEVPSFAVDIKAIDRLQFDIFNDELYRTEKRKLEHKEIESGEYLLSGIIEKGRSGSPVFVEGTDKCLGVVSGYYEDKRQTLILAP